MTDVIEKFKDITLSVVMPVYNEIATIGEILRRVQAAPIPKEIIVVDDGSTDGTRDILRGVAARGEARIVFMRKNCGKGAALREGLKRVTGDIVIIQDADLEYYPDEYPQMIELIVDGKADVVYGSRFLGRHRAYLFWHYMGNLLINFIANLLYNTTLTDLETCYKAFRREVLDGMKLYSNSFGFEPEFTARVFQRDLRVYEVPISYAGRTYEEGKKITWRDGFVALYWLIWCKFFGFDINREMLARMGMVSRYSRWISGRILPFLGEKVLEIGSSVGNITRRLLGPRQVIASDKSAKVVDNLRRHFVEGDKLRIVQYDVADPPPAALCDAGIDTIVAINVLEHVKGDDAALRSMRDILRPGGRAVLVVPAFATIYCRLDENLGHYRRYDKIPFLRKVKAAGFAITRCTYLNMLGAPGWLINGKILRRGMMPKQQMRLFNKMAWILDLEELIGPPFGLSLLVIAEKK
ncbi:MAG: glycosyltransferase [Planctomycetota bacterium]